MNHSAKDIASMLAGRAEQVCQILLPNGKRVGGEYRVGSLSGEAGDSLGVHLSGSKAGVWCDFASGYEKGDLLDLWCKVKGVNLSAAIAEAKEYLGIREPRFITPAKNYSKPPKSKAKRLQPDSKVFKYLTNDRKLSAESLNAFKVSEKLDEIVFPFISPDGQPVNIKYMSVNRDNGKKSIRTESGCAPGLFGWQAIDGETRVVAITEGEIDAITMHQYGVSALSAPFGAGKGAKNDWIDYEWNNLERFDTIYLVFDNDDPGRQAIPEIAERLGRHRCKHVILPKKDANECLQQDVGGDKIAEALQNAKPMDPVEICDPVVFMDKVLKWFYPPDEHSKGLETPLTKPNIIFRPGELTIWTGVSGHGKSLLLGQIAIFAALSYWRVAIASMEMSPQQTLGRMINQITCTYEPTEYQIEKSLHHLSNKLWIYDILGNIKGDKILGLMEYSRKRHGVTHFVIDSLMKCAVDGDDYNAQRMFMNDLTTFTKQHGCHIHLVAHARKSGGEKEVGGKLEVKGSSDIINQADNVITVWRNKPKERARNEGQEYNSDDPDAIMFCDKQRETGWEGRIHLYYNPKAKQYGTHPREGWNFWRGIFASEGCE